MEKIEDAKLFLCPYCGGTDFVLIEDVTRASITIGAYNKVVRCINCGVTGPSCQTAFDAMEAWNKIPRGEFYPGSDDPTLNGLDCKPRNNAEKTVADTLADRQQDYGDAKESFDRIARLWNIWLAGKSTIAAHDVAMMMVLFKVAREKHKTKDDNLVDIGGYAELARRL